MNTSTACKDLEYTMPYARYKRHYADCKTVPGSYDKDYCTITVLIPAGRLKPSGTRGQHYRGYEMWCEDCYTGNKYRMVYRAVSEENAIKQHQKECRARGFQPCDPPEGRIAQIYIYR